jgi:protein arginine kinase
MSEKSELPSFLLEHTLWENEASPIWPASSFILHRNLNKYNFPSKLDEPGFLQTFELIKNALLNSPELSQPLLLKADETSAVDKEYLFEHFLCLGSFQNTQKGQGFALDHSGCFLALVNIEDHLVLQLVDSKGDWENAWNRLSKIETSLGNSLEYAYSPKFGYLTSNPDSCGTGLTVLVYLHLPALIHQGEIEDALIKEKQEGVIASGMQGTLDELVGDLLVLRNQYTLGIAEETILHSLHMSAMKLIVAEKTTRNRLQQENNAEMKDQISRAYGLLVHSYQLETKEALDALSLIKLGIDLGWISGINDQKINEAFFKCRRAHLTLILHANKVEPQEMLRKRAEYLHQQLQGMQLKT